MPSSTPKQIDRYILNDTIGSGGFASVYRATDTRMQREVALKVIADVKEPDVVARFRQEAQTAANLHPNGRDDSLCLARERDRRKRQSGTCHEDDLDRTA